MTLSHIVKAKILHFSPVCMCIIISYIVAIINTILTDLHLHNWHSDSLVIIFIIVVIIIIIIIIIIIVVIMIIILLALAGGDPLVELRLYTRRFDRLLHHHAPYQPRSDDYDDHDCGDHLSVWSTKVRWSSWLWWLAVIDQFDQPRLNIYGDHWSVQEAPEKSFTRVCDSGFHMNSLNFTYVHMEQLIFLDKHNCIEIFLSLKFVFISLDEIMTVHPTNLNFKIVLHLGGEMLNLIPLPS